ADPLVERNLRLRVHELQACLSADGRERVLERDLMEIEGDAMAEYRSALRVEADRNVFRSAREIEAWSSLHCSWLDRVLGQHLTRGLESHGEHEQAEYGTAHDYLRPKTR